MAKDNITRTPRKGDCGGTPRVGRAGDSKPSGSGRGRGRRRRGR